MLFLLFLFCWGLFGFLNSFLLGKISKMESLDEKEETDNFVRGLVFGPIYTFFIGAYFVYKYAKK